MPKSYLKNFTKETLLRTKKIIIKYQRNKYFHCQIFTTCYIYIYKLKNSILVKKLKNIH